MRKHDFLEQSVRLHAAGEDVAPLRAVSRPHDLTVEQRRKYLPGNRRLPSEERSPLVEPPT